MFKWKRTLVVVLAIAVLATVAGVAMAADGITATLNNAEQNGLLVEGNTISGTVDLATYQIPDAATTLFEGSATPEDGKFAIIGLTMQGFNADKKYCIEQINPALPVIYPGEENETYKLGKKIKNYSGADLNGEYYFGIVPGEDVTVNIYETTDTTEGYLAAAPGTEPIKTVTITNNVAFVPATTLPAIGKDTVKEANIEDHSTAHMTDLYETYGVTVGDPQDGTIPVTITATDLQKHTNGQSKVGYWMGFSVLAPEKATQYKAVAAKTPFDTVDLSTEILSDLDINVDGTDADGVAIYTELANNTGKKLYAAVQWYNAKNEAISDVTYFAADLTGVTLFEEGSQNDPISPDSIVAAPLADKVDSTKVLYDNYSVTTTADTKNHVKIVVKATNLVKHINGIDQEGYWVGFSVKAPAEAETMNYVFASTPISVPVTNWTEADADLEVNVDGNDTPGIAFYANKVAAEPKIYAALQWLDAKGEVINKTTYFTMDLSGVGLKVDEIKPIEKIPTVDGNGKATAAIDNENKKALETALSEAANQGNPETPAVVEIKVIAESGNDGVKEAEITLDKDIVTALANADEKVEVKITTDVGAITVNSDVLNQIKTEVGANGVKLVVKKADKNPDGNLGEKLAAANLPVVEFQFQKNTGGEIALNNPNFKITLTIEAPTDATNPKAFYIDDTTGKISFLSNQNVEDGKVTAVTEHLSTFAVGDFTIKFNDGSATTRKLTFTAPEGITNEHLKGTAYLTYDTTIGSGTNAVRGITTFQAVLGENEVQWDKTISNVNAWLTNSTPTLSNPGDLQTEILDSASAADGQ